MRPGISGLVFALVLGIVVLPPAARAQQPAKVPRIGYLTTGSGPSPHDEAFRQGLRDLGYVEGKNIGIEFRWAEGKN
jgi:putative ABC transport system substrate-binding protein